MKRVDEGVKVFLFLILISQLFFLNGVYLFTALGCFYLGIYFLQQQYKSSIFTIIFSYHFLQIYAGIWLATYLGNDINYRSANMGFATIISLIGLLVMFTPIAYYQNKIPKISYETLKIHAEKFSLNKTFYTYVAVFFISSALNGIRFLLPGYTQFIITIVNLKWLFFLLFGFQCLIKNKRKNAFYFFIILEFVLGLYSFFSDFKVVIFFAAVLYFTLLTTFNIKKLILFSIIAFVTFSGATLWTSIKGEYRQFLNKGQLSQNVAVSQNEAFAKLYELTNTKGQQVLTTTTAKFLDRLQGTHFLAKTIDRVPSIIPYQGGKNWKETFDFVFTPRLLNPDKPQLDASVKVSKYTGIQYAGLSQGTSFSLGYFADCYIDFGVFGMILSVFAIGLLYGVTYFYFLRNSSSNFIFNYSVVCTLYMRFFAFEMDSIFFIGGLFTDLLMYFLLLYFFFPWLYRFLSENKEKDL
jgi:hypothetical protein